jgi:hypothetical protein
VVDQDRVDGLLATLARYVRLLRDLSEVSLADYQADPRNSAAPSASSSWRSRPP